MKVKGVANLMYYLNELYFEADVTFGNNKVPVTKIVYDEKSNSVNLR